MSAAAPPPPPPRSSLHVDAAWKLFAFASVAACTAELVTTPIDALKTRLQLLRTKGRFPPALATLRAVVAAEGVGALYAGAPPAVARAATYGALRVGLYEPLKNALGGGASPPFALKALAACGAGATAALACTPLDVLKVRAQAGGGGGGGGGAPRALPAALLHLYRAEGARGLYRGLGATAARAAVVAAAEIASYDEFKARGVAAGARGDAASTHVAASVAAGGVASLAAAPVDLVKTRVQQGGGGSGGALAVLRATVAAEGAAALWRGVGADFARRAPHCVISFSVLEQLRAAFSR